MNASTYLDLKRRVIEAGYERDVAWAENVGPVASYSRFAEEYIWVVINSGMKAQVAEGIAKRVWSAIEEGKPIRDAFGHPGKAAAIERVLSQDGARWFDEYTQLLGDEARLAYLETLPWIGKVTKWHLAKNLGVDCAKPDRHLVRIAGSEQAAHEMCSRLAAKTGDRVATVDYVIWRAANLGWI
jgi:hypothetical protein